MIKILLNILLVVLYIKLLMEIYNIVFYRGS